ncbi:MAG: M50 family metallopeptidase [Jatrophihabitans sp.]|uniref:M50 family metallopeptidase n=1 Tax=Jatrophihabitans sp. TaxID=1932789 RepID=UPI003F7D2ADC
MPTWLLYTFGVVFFVVGLLLSIALHEIGHMVPAKKFGVKVTQYMVGFGPTVFSRKRGDTEYGIKAIPAGGYIRMIGMVPPRADGRRSRWPRRIAATIEDFRQTSRHELDPQDEHRQFYRLTPGKKMIVMVGGPTMNLLIYLVLTLVLLTTLGTPHDDPTTTVGDISKCVVKASTPANQVPPCTVPNAPAARDGLQPGDTVVAIDSTPVKTWDETVAIIEKSADRTIVVHVLRAGKPVALRITPVENQKCANADCTAFKTAGFIGASPHFRHYYQAVPISGVPGQIGDQIRTGWDRLMQYPQRIGDLFGTIFENKPRDVNSAVGVIGIGRISGDFAGSKLLDRQDKIYTLVSLLASVNLLLFFFNLLPLLPLDGGHVAGAIVEAIRRGMARVRGRREQIFVDTAQMLPVMYAVAGVLLVLTVLTAYADIVKPIDVLGG